MTLFGRRIGIGAVLAAAAVSIGCGAPPGSETTRELGLPIADGARDTTHHGVAGMFAHWSDLVGVCSGTLIADNLVLTARHCISEEHHDPVQCDKAPLGAARDADGIYFTFDETIQPNSFFFQAEKVFLPPGGEDTCGFDVALVRLKRNVPRDVAEPVVPRIDEAVQSGEVYTAVGYGARGAIEEEPSVGDRLMLEDLKVMCGSNCGAGVRDTEFRGDSGVCRGDSGGPALDTLGRVIGVASRGTADCGSPIYASTPAWSAWIKDVTRKAAAAGDYGEPSWLKTGDTSPGSDSIQGKPCQGSSSCGDGHECYFESNPDDAYCAARCVSASDCSAGLVCDSALQLCVGADPVEDTGCAMAHPCSSRGASALAVWLAVGALAWRSSSRRQTSPPSGDV